MALKREYFNGKPRLYTVYVQLKIVSRTGFLFFIHRRPIEKSFH